jgi:DNA topoisomerase VI subunit A
MFNIFSHQGNANQNYTEIPSHLNQNKYYQKTQNITSAGEMQDNRNLYTMLAELQISPSITEISMEIPEKLKNRTTMYILQLYYSIYLSETKSACNRMSTEALFTTAKSWN